LTMVMSKKIRTEGVMLKAFVNSSKSTNQS